MVRYLEDRLSEKESNAHSLPRVILQNLLYLNDKKNKIKNDIKLI